MEAVIQVQPDCDCIAEPDIDLERSKGLPRGMFVGMDGVVYGFDEDEARRQNTELGKNIDRTKLRELARQMKPVRAKLEEDDPEF